MSLDGPEDIKDELLEKKTEIKVMRNLFIF